MEQHELAMHAGLGAHLLSLLQGSCHEFCICSCLRVGSFMSTSRESSLIVCLTTDCSCKTQILAVDHSQHT